MALVSAEEEAINGATFTAVESAPSVQDDAVTDDITDVLTADIPIKELSKKHLIKLLQYRTDGSQEAIADLVGCAKSYVSGVVGDLPANQQPEIVGTLHECREHDLIRYVKCLEDGAVFDLERIGWTRRPKYLDERDPTVHVDWFQHNRFEGYVVKPMGEEPSERPDGAVTSRHVIET